MAAADDEVRLPVLGASWDLERVVADHDVQQVIVTFSTAPHEVLLRLVQRCEDLGLDEDRGHGLVRTARHPGTVTPGCDRTEGPARTRGRRQRQPSSCTTTGAWSLAPVPLRSSRSIAAPVTRAASAGEASTKSIRMPCFLGNRSCV